MLTVAHTDVKAKIIQQEQEKKKQAAKRKEEWKADSVRSRNSNQKLKLQLHQRLPGLQDLYLL